MSVDDEVRALESFGLQALREDWRERFGAPPKLRSPELMRRCLAWRIQLQAYGGIEPGLRRRLRGEGRVGDGLEHGGRIVREWRGQRHEVEVVDGGYLWKGRRFRSLSPIALEITGTRWNGPKFFGLRPGR